MYLEGRGERGRTVIISLIITRMYFFYTIFITTTMTYDTFTAKVVNSSKGTCYFMQVTIRGSPTTPPLLKMDNRVLTLT